VYVPRRQRVLVKQGEEFWRMHEIKPYRVFPEELAERPESFVFHVPSSTARELITAGALDRTGVVLVVVRGLPQDAIRSRAARASRRAPDQPHPRAHVGHASVFDLRRLVEALGPKRVVPIRSDAGDRFCELFPRSRAKR
jgi:ribonuclease J